MSPTVESITHAMREKTSGTDYEFPYGKSTVRRLLRSMEFSHKRVQRKPTRAEACDIIAWTYPYIEQIRELCLQGYSDVYLDETWYDSYMCRMKNWTDNSENCLVPMSGAKGDRIVIVHCGGRFGFIDGALAVTHKKMANAPADYHGTMNSAIIKE
ncbi:hypothetical protein ANN_00226 [Periplaneta americana]|uniref:Uncharacterized protein n=1 Tax=Periplaneta americana TaxID=6978 RepID=A0ABQ8TT27_PERAM|nr:hypothetical protein ANN_00226 [Periplaneta americana]